MRARMKDEAEVAFSHMVPRDSLLDATDDASRDKDRGAIMCLLSVTIYLMMVHVNKT